MSDHIPRYLKGRIPEFPSSDSRDYSEEEKEDHEEEEEDTGPEPVEITLEPVSHINVRIQGYFLGSFRKVSEWHGMVDLEGDLGTLVLDCNYSEEDREIDEFMGMPVDFKDIKILKASKKVGDRIREIASELDKLG